MSLNSNHFGFFSKVQEVEIKPNDITGHHDGFKPYLWAQLHCKFRKPDIGYEFDVLTICARLKLRGPGCALATVNVFPNVSIDRPEQTFTEILKFPLDQLTIEFIEKIRKGDLELDFELEFQLLYGEKIGVGSNLQRGIKGLSTGQIFLQPVVPKSIWVEKVLKELRYGAFKLIEVPMNHGFLKEAYDSIISEFQKAEEYYKKQDHDKCVAHCRSTMDALTRNLKKINEGKDSEKAFEWLKKVNKETYEFIDGVNKANQAVTSPPHHAGHNRTYQRHEADSIYLITLGLLNLVGNTKPI